MSLEAGGGIPCRRNLAATLFVLICDDVSEQATKRVQAAIPASAMEAGVRARGAVCSWGYRLCHQVCSQVYS